ncbi:hypothetical protein [uncultured Proteiniphilum sp.]|uniref:hypothetical protein n=1 Tax=uncultured Proteiniphilum sp. TaxID=497637 RepID=UPI00261394ED|nr:hypothetical protein [uncultured Proteiniphilum sp.]
MKKNHFRMLFGFIVMALFMLSCENNLEIVLPQGPKGDKGDKGDAGKSAFELWIEVNEKDPNTPIEDFFNSLKGEDGIDGVNGKSAYELWKEAVDKGEMTNKDSSEYTGGNTWEDFLVWLQGGDVFALFEFWKTLPGNGNKTIREFMDELFKCFCHETPGLTPVEVEEWTLSIVDDHFLLLTLKGTPGMTVTAMDAFNHNNFVVLTESPAGTYSTSDIPRTYSAYTILVRAEMEGYGSVDRIVEVGGNYLLKL